MTDNTTVQNCILLDNNAPGRGGGAFCGGRVVLSTCIVQGNTAALSGGGGVYWHGYLQDSLLAIGSPCIDAGTNQAWMAGALDLAGTNRILNGVVDMGAYEFTGLADSDGDGLPDDWEWPFFGSLTNLTANGDWDGDGFRDAWEYPAGTDPTNPASYLGFMGIVRLPAGAGTGSPCR